jgi:Caspase domain/Sel1 repeat
MQMLTKDTAGMRARHVVLIVDACCSGFMTRRGNFEERMDLPTLLKNPSRQVVAATTETQAAIARRAGVAEHGIFTAALLEVLSVGQPAEALSVTDVFVKVRERVIATSNKTMTPQMSHFGASSGEFVFIPLAIPEAEVQAAAGARALLKTLRRARDRQNLRTSLTDVIDAFEAMDYTFAADSPHKSEMWAQRSKRFEENAVIGDEQAMAALHYCYSKGLGVEKNDVEAYHWAKSAFYSGYPGGKHVLGRCLLYGIGVRKNEIAGLDLIAEAAKGGFPISIIQTEPVGG